jgi:hypothetical protein
MRNRLYRMSVVGYMRISASGLLFFLAGELPYVFYLYIKAKKIICVECYFTRPEAKHISYLDYPQRNGRYIYRMSFVMVCI